MHFVAAFMLAMASLAPAQDLADVVPTAEEIKGRIQAIKEGSGDDKAILIGDYERALAALLRAGEARRRTQEFAADAEEAPNLIALLRAELAGPPTESILLPDAFLSIQELGSRLEKARADLVASRTQVAELEAIAGQRVRRRGAIPEEIAALQQRVTSALQMLSALPAAANNEARRAYFLTQIDELRATITTLETERDTYAVRRELLPLRRDRALRRIAQAERVAAFWRDIENARRAAEGAAAAKRAKEQVERVASRFQPLRELALKTHELAERRSGAAGIPERISAAQAGLESTRVQLEALRRRFHSARRRISAGGLTEGMGRILRRDYESLPLLSVLRVDSKAREDLLSAAQLEFIVTEEERDTIGDLNTAMDRILEASGVQNQSEELREAARELLLAQRSSHDAILDGLETLSSTFYEHKRLTSTLISDLLAYRGFIEERILWVRSSPANPIESALATPAHATQFARTLWTQATRQELSKRATQHWGELFAKGLLLFALLALRRLLKQQRQAMGENVRSYRTDAYIYTARALVQSFLLALPLPLIAWSAGRLLAESQGELVSAVGGGLREVSTIWLFLRLLRELAADKGVGAAHFRWPNDSVAALRRELRWFEPLVLVLGLVALTLNRQSSIEWADSVGRNFFVGAMAALAVVVHRLLRADSPMWATSPSEGRGLLRRTHAIWSVVAFGLPATLALLALAGYYYTALQFELRLRYSIGFAVALVIVNALLLRWLFMTRRRLAVRQALEIRARKEQEQASEGTTESNPSALDADKVDIPAIDAQTRQLFKTSTTLAAVVGIFFIWASVLPALQGLDRVQLLPTMTIISSATDMESSGLGLVSSAASSADPDLTASLPGTESSRQAASAGEGTGDLGLPSKLTLADVFLALLIALLAGVAAKNLPALLELSILQRLPLDGGSRYAVSTIVRYVIWIAAVSAISGALGIGWQKIQWLAAALTFGLAFGLQEIFANFVSGLIILIERPIRVGDIVTVDGTEGRVTQLRMRATTILDWDRREFLVPNKQLITGSVINWTLSDPTTRMTIRVGIAYGSDTALARRLLLDAAKKNPLVLRDPAPSAIFRSFGASSLDFELRAFIANRDFWPELIDKLHSQIDAAFRKAGIEIAFPQRDLHIRSADGIGSLRRAEDEQTGSTKS